MGRASRGKWQRRIERYEAAKWGVRDAFRKLFGHHRKFQV